MASSSVLMYACSCGYETAVFDMSALPLFCPECVGDDATRNHLFKLQRSGVRSR